MATTLYRIDGVKLSNGKQAYGSKEMSAWLPVYIRYMWEIHKIRIVVIKVADLSATVASASTHVGGFAWDGRTWNITVAQQRKHIYESTRFGGLGTLRTRSQGFTPHSHNMLDVGRWTNCSYQIAAIKRGRTGLGAGGNKGYDPDKAYRPDQPWPLWAVGLAAMLAALNPVKINEIPRYYTSKPWMQIPVDGVRSGLFWSRVQWQLNIKPTGVLDHYTVRALKVWLGNKDDGTGVLSPIHVQQLQYRVGVGRDGVWGPVTTRAFQRFLNNNR